MILSPYVFEATASYGSGKGYGEPLKMLLLRFTSGSIPGAILMTTQNKKTNVVSISLQGSSRFALSHSLSGFLFLPERR